MGDWHFDCVESGHRVEQLLRFNVVNIDGKPIEDVGFSSLFHQQYPVSITYVDGAESVINIPTIAEDKEDRKLEDEIVELARMKSQLLKLQERISLKEKLLSDEFGYVQGGSDHAGCGSFKCVFTSAWKKAHGRLSTYFHGHFSKSQHDIGRTKEHSVDEPTTEDYGGPIRVGDDSSFRGQQSQLFRQGNQRTSPEPTTMSTTPVSSRDYQLVTRGFANPLILGERTTPHGLQVGRHNFTCGHNDPRHPLFPSGVPFLRKEPRPAQRLSTGASPAQPQPPGAGARAPGRHQSRHEG